MMLLGHSMPAVTAVSFSASLSGGGFLGGTQDGLYDQAPSRVARLSWMSTAGGTDAELRFTLQFTGLSRVRLVGLLGVTLPPGLLVVAELFDGATQISGASEILRALPPANARGAWFIFSDNVAPCDRVRITFYNDLDGSTAIAANQIFEVGEVVAMDAVDIELGSDWSIAPVDPSDVRYTRDSQAAINQRDLYRLFTGTLTVQPFEGAFSDGLPGAQDLVGLQAALSGDRRCVAIPRYKFPTGLVDMSRVVPLTLYGRGQLSKIAHIGGDNFTAEIMVQELPARAP